MREAFRIGADAVDRFAQGARVFGSGGGGDPAVGCAALKRALTLRDTAVDVVPASQLPADAVVVPFGFIGATGLLPERPPSGEEVRDSCLAVHPNPAGIVTMEIGGFNGVSAVWAAALLGVPLVDADLMGRALPGLDQMLPLTSGWSLCPAVIEDVHGRRVRLEETSALMIEAIARAALATVGGWAVLGCNAMRAGDIDATAHPGTVGQAMTYGAQVAELGGAVRRGLPGSTPFGEGRVVDVTRGRPRHGRRSPATTVVVELTEPEGGVLRLEAESEWLAVVVDGLPAATVPELIVVWDVDSHEILAVDNIRHGRNVSVFALPGQQGWWRPEALPIVEPAAFALDIPPCRIG